MEDRDFKGIWIPKEIWTDTTLNIREKCLLAEISSLDRGEGCYAGNEYLALFLGVAASTIANMVSSLHKRGQLETVRFDGRNRWVRLTKNSKADLLETVTQTSESSEGYIYSSSNKNRNKGREKITRSLEFSDTEKEEFKNEYPTVDIETELDIAREFLDSTGRVYQNYRSFFKGWLKKERKFVARRRTDFTPEKPKSIWDIPGDKIIRL